MTLDSTVTIAMLFCSFLASLHVVWRLRDLRSHQDDTPRLLRRSPRESGAQGEAEAS